MYYPILVDLKERRCVVVGGGRVGERRARALLDHGAQVRVVAPSITAGLRDLADLGRIVWMNALYRDAHIDDAFLVVAATDLPEINQAVIRDANERNILACDAGAFEQGSFVAAAAIRRGHLIMTVSTSGDSPTLASILREDLEGQFGPEWATLTSIMGKLRDELKARHATEDARKSAVRAVIACDAVWEAIGRGDQAEAEALARQCL